MKKHFYLQNPKSVQLGYRRQRNIAGAEEDRSKVISQAKIEVFRSFYSAFNGDKETRDRNRTLDLPVVIDYIQIGFYETFNSDLRTKFYRNYGLTPVDYTDFNRTVLFEVEDESSFNTFKEHIEVIIDSDEDLEYGGQDYNLIALISDFSFFDDRLKTYDNEGLIINIVDRNTRASDQQTESLIEFLDDNKIEYDIDESQEFVFIKQMEEVFLNVLNNNFDIIKGILSSRPLTIRPGAYGTMRVEYGFQVEIPENLPIVGIIDTGISEIEPLKDLLVGSINITEETNDDLSGHGTLVAGLAAFGTALPHSVQDSYTAKCKLLPIKILHRGDDPIDFVGLLWAIEKAHTEYGVRIFNMSVVFGYTKKYNEAFSDFAYKLDELAYKLDILIFIAVGNFDHNTLHSLLREEYQEDHDYPDFFYNLNSRSDVHNCENTNIVVPSESLNNVSVGALAGNIEEGENSDVTPLNIYPAYYTRKFHYDYNQQINGVRFKNNQKNKHLNKPDLVFDGGDYFNDDSGIEVLAREGEYYMRTAGTSLATPLITSMAAEILNVYPDIKIQAVKALLINSAGYYSLKHIPHFKNKEKLLHKLIGFGKPDENLLVQSSNNSITFIIEDEIKSEEIMAIPLYLPEYLRESGNKLIFNISLAYKFKPNRSGHLDYLPLNIGFTLIQNLSIETLYPPH